MLKVQVDGGQDYLDYLQPFILQVIIDHQITLVTDKDVKEYIRSDFGIEIPVRTIQIVLARLARKYSIKKENGVYQITNNLPNPRIGIQKINAQRHIDAVLSGLRDYSKKTIKPIETDEEADLAIRAFLSHFTVQFLKEYLRGTAIPDIESQQNSYDVLVSKYVLELKQHSPERYESFSIVVKGHMLANALLCPDLQINNTYNGVTFYLDTPLVIQLIGLEGQDQQDSINELIKLLIRLNGRISVFEHTRNEVENVIIASAHNIDQFTKPTTIILEARKKRMTKSDMMLLAGKIDEKLRQHKVEIQSNPRYTASSRFDETAFSIILNNTLQYKNPNAKEFDISSVRNIYMLRAGAVPRNVERSIAVLVTSNTALAKAAFQYSQEHHASQAISSIIVDFSLANISWLKTPIEAPSVPMREVLAFSYAALQPSDSIWEKYLAEIEKLENQPSVTTLDHQLLRSNPQTISELMSLTLGDEKALTQQTLTEVLDYVKKEIKQEEHVKLEAEINAHEQTKSTLTTKNQEISNTQTKVYNRANRRARILAQLVFWMCIVLVILGMTSSLWINFDNFWVNYTVTGISVIFGVLGTIWGKTLIQIRDSIHTCYRKWLINRDSIKYAIDMTEYDENNYK